MVYEIVWTIQAINQLKDIKDYIAGDSLFYAGKTVEMIFAQADKLSKYPAGISGFISFSFSCKRNPESSFNSLNMSALLFICCLTDKS